LLDVLKAISSAPLVSAAAVETRDRAITQVIGFVSLYVFLGILLHSYKMPVPKKGTGNYGESQMRKPVPNIYPLWAFPLGAIVTLVALLLQIDFGAVGGGNLTSVLFLPSLYSVMAGSVIAILTCFTLKYLS
jgi:hypothetical protein